MGLMAAAAVATLPAAPAAASGGGGCGEPVTDATGSTVTIRGYCFRLTVLHTEPGVQVTFENRDPVRHNVLGANATWGSFETLRAGQSSTYRFSEPGVYPFVCAWHPGMVGAVLVGSGDTTSSPWKAVAVAAAGMLLLVVVGTAERRRRAAA